MNRELGVPLGEGKLMGLQGEETAAWFGRARAALVNGVSSQFRYWGDDDTMVIDHGEGGHVITHTHMAQW